MQTLEIDKSNALRAYNEADTNGKNLLINLFGKNVFQQKITDQVKSFDDACEVLGLDPNQIFTGHETPDEVAYKKIKLIARALNEGWTPNWDNEDEAKWYPWFYMNSESGFSLDYVYCGYAHSSVCSRLCFRSRDLAEYAAKQFLSEYKAFFTL